MPTKTSLTQLDNQLKKLESYKVNKTTSSSAWKPFPGPQQKLIDSDADEVFFGGAAGGGKALDLGTPIPTPTGWTKIGDIKAGDMVFDERGGTTSVIHAYQVNLFPESYRITFDDGSVVDACEHHKWLTYNAKELGQLTRLDSDWRGRRQARRPSQVSGRKSDKFATSLAERNRTRSYTYKESPKGGIRTTKEIFETLRVRNGSRVNHAVPLAKAVEMPEATLPIDPYLLGVWIGDGTTSKGTITTVDPQILEAFKDRGYEQGHTHKITTLFHGLHKQLRQLGVLGDKHVPVAYLRASKAQRLELLKGLMDSDGTVDKRSGAVSFSNTNVRIIDAVHELISSLGWKANVCSDRATLYGKDCGPVWNIKWTPSEYVFKLERKLKWQNLARRRTVQFRYIVNCERISSKPMRCLTVDNPTSLFLCGRSFIPTHNSASIVGMALTRHYRSLILRRDASQLTDVIDQLKQFAPTGSHWRGIGNGGKMTTPDGRVIELAGMPHEDDKRKYQGRPHDLKAFDEVTELTESQVEFVSSWNRSTRPGQHCMKLLTGNPPTHSGGGWILRRYAPWIDPSYPRAAKPGQKLYFARIEGKDDEEEFPDATPIEFKGLMITPQSRTFIPAKLADNPKLRDTNYASRLAHMPPALRDALLFGDFSASLQDDPWAVIPTSWIRAALQRWESNGGDGIPLTRAGLDIAYGGSDSTVLALRHGNWIAPFHSWQGDATDSGKKAAKLVLPILKGSKAPVNVDVIGYGAACFEFLKENNVTVAGVNFGAGASQATDRRGILQFSNMRALCYWNLRDMLDPELGDNLALPPDDDLLAELAAPKYEYRSGKIFIRSKEDISSELGRSPDKADAVALACYQPPVVPFMVESW